MADVDSPASSNRVTAWSVETNPKYTRAWLESLSPIDNLEAARELYQGLCALNRNELEATARLELMQLYGSAVRDACDSLQNSFARVNFPLPVSLRRLAASLAQMHVEMAFGFKLGFQHVTRAWLTPWRRRQLLLSAAERALYHLSEVLLRCYHLYLPYPAGVWRDAHALYRLVELHGKQDESIEAEEGKDKIRISVSQRYRRLLMLGAAGPYQMPYGECLTVNRFLGRWIDQVRLLPSGDARTEGDGCFLFDTTADTPPAPPGHYASASSGARVLDASELVRTLHVFLRRLERGEQAAELNLGVECLDSVCHDLLQRLHRVYAQTATRRHSRIKRHETVMICAGTGALHFFVSGQKSFVKVITGTEEDATVELNVSPPPAVALDGDATYVALDEPGGAASPAGSPESFRVDRWQVRDVSPQGLLIAQDDEPRVRFRIGDVLGIQRTSAPGHWSVGLVRWCKARGERGIEAGVELIAPDAVPASLRPIAEGESAVPVLKLPAVEVVHRPASLLVPRGAVQVGKDFFLADMERGIRRVRALDSIERTNAVEQIIVGDVIDGA